MGHCIAVKVYDQHLVIHREPKKTETLEMANTVVLVLILFISVNGLLARGIRTDDNTSSRRENPESEFEDMPKYASEDQLDRLTQLNQLVESNKRGLYCNCDQSANVYSGSVDVLVVGNG